MLAAVTGGHLSLGSDLMGLLTACLSLGRTKALHQAGSKRRTPAAGCRSRRNGLGIRDDHLIERFKDEKNSFTERPFHT